MPTVTTSEIGTGGDYTTLQAWEDDMTADLVSADEQAVGECYDQTFNASSNILTIAGHTTDATRNIILTTNGTASFKDKAGVRTTALIYNASNGTAITCTTGYVELITIDDTFVTLRGLQVSHTGSGGAEPIIDSQVANATYDKCIFYGHRRHVNIKAASSVVSNCLFQFTTGGIGINLLGGGGTNQCRNNTFVTPGTAAATGVYAEYSTLVCVNSAFFNLATDTSLSGGGSLAGSDYNATDESSFPVGSNNVTSLTFADQFENSTNDFRAASDGDLGAGTPDATYAPDDISDFTRDGTTPWIGAWEVGVAVSAAITGTATATINEGHVNVGGKTIIITLTGDTWAAAGTGPIGAAADTQAIIDGISAASSPSGGWNNEWRDKEATSAVVRTSDTVCTITMSSQSTISGSYTISSQETITVTVPAAALVSSGDAVVATPTFTVDPGFSGTSLASDDDAYQRQDSGVFSSSATTLGMIAGQGGSSYSSGARFLPGIPIGATITSAVVAFTASGGSDDPEYTIYCEDVDDAANFTTTAQVWSRTRTTASASYSDSNVGTGSVNTSDFTDAVQEVVDRAGWTAASHLMVLFICPTGGSAKTHLPDSFDHATAGNRPVLHVAWTIGAASTGPPKGTLTLLGVGI